MASPDAFHPRATRPAPTTARKGRTISMIVVSRGSAARRGKRASRRSDDGRAWRDVPGHHRTCSDDRALPDSDAAHDHCPRSERRATLDHRALERPVVLGLEAAVGVRRARTAVVDEHHAVPDEDLVLDVDAAADERMTLDLATCPDRCVALDLDERPDAGAVADPAAVEVCERLYAHVVPELDVVDEPVRSVVGGLIRHRRTRESRKRLSPPAPRSFPGRSAATAAELRDARRLETPRARSRARHTPSSGARAPGSAFLSRRPSP